MAQLIEQPVPIPKVSLRPLCVDLDGTLVKSDTLIDSLLVLARSNPVRLLSLPAWCLQGKAAFKEFVTQSVALDVVNLPYNHKVLEYLQEQYNEGREIYLATGANVALARRVADHLGIFAGVLGSDSKTNLTGNNKLAGLRSRLGERAFDYIGNGSPDLSLLSHATEPMLANPSLPLRIGLRSRGIRPTREFLDRNRPAFSLLRAMRPHQWTKNFIIFLPVLLAHDFALSRLLSGVIAFCAFCLAASATYMLNDLLDIESDRRHPNKRRRPFAAGDLSAFPGLFAAVVFLLVAFAGIHTLPAGFYGWLIVYLITTCSYSLFLKRVPIVDVIVLSGLYTLRLQAGSVATDAPISHWLAGFSIFLFLSLAIAKRFAELENLRASGAQLKNGRGYLITDIEQIRSFGTASAYAAAVIFAIYISGGDVMVLYHHPSYLWLIVPLMILWLSRVWLLASRGELNEDPVVFALTDRMSLLIGLIVAAIALLAM